MRLFILTLKKYLSDNRRSLLLKLGSMAVAWIFIGAILAVSGVGGGDGEKGLLFCSAMVAACVFASRSFADMQRPAGRISVLMLPSTPTAKFMARWVVAVPVALTVLFCCCWLAETTRVLIWPLCGHETGTHFLHLSGKTGNGVLPMLVAVLFFQSFFLFGAIVWPRLSFLKTLIAGWVLQALVSICTITFWPRDGHFAFYPGDYDNEINLIIIIIVSLLTLFFYRLAFLRLRESDLADRLL